MATASAELPARARRRTLVDRMVAAFPLAALVVTVFVFYGVEAWSRKTPYIFTDELEWSQISRSIAATGHAARRGQPIEFKSLYVFVIAPFWWIHSTATAYAAIKYANVVLMTLSAVPTYLLARMVVSRRGAVAAAVLSIAVPAMSYVTTIIIEVPAYPYCALCSWLSVRGLRSGRLRDLALAAAVCAGGLLVRAPQFVTLPLALLIAGGWLALTSTRARALRRSWTRGDRLCALVLALGLAVLFNRVVLQHLMVWQFTTEYYKNRMVDLGLDAALGFIVGVGVLPVIGGFAALRLPERRGDPAYRAFAAWLGSTILCLGVYTALKAAYLSTNFGTYWEERDLIYLCPLVMIATVLVFESRRLDWIVVAAASALVLATVLLKSFQSEWPYFEAPGFGVTALLGVYENWSQGDDRLLMVALLALSLALLALRRVRFVAGLALLLGLAWMLSGEISDTVGIDRGADAYVANLTHPLDWVDVYDHGQPATYLGQEIVSPFGEELTEFWNRSIKHVESLDGTAPGPGPATRPLVVSDTGLLSGIGGHYVLADDGVALQATKVHAGLGGVMELYYSASGRWRLLDNEEQVYSDGWCPAWCAYTYFKPHERGTLEVVLARTGYNGKTKPGDAYVQVGTVGLTNKGVPMLVRLSSQRHTLVPDGSTQTIDFRVTSTPVRVVVNVAPDSLIPPSPGDERSLGAQVSFTFVPGNGPPQGRASTERTRLGGRAPA